MNIHAVFIVNTSLNFYVHLCPRINGSIYTRKEGYVQTFAQELCCLDFGIKVHIINLMQVHIWISGPSSDNNLIEQCS